MENAVRKAMENPAVQKAGKFGIALVGGILLLKGAHVAGKWVAEKTAPFRAELAAEYQRKKKEIKKEAKKTKKKNGKVADKQPAA